MLEIVIQLYGYEIILSALLLENPQSNLTKQRSSQGLVFSFKFSVSSSFILGWHPSLKKNLRGKAISIFILSLSLSPPRLPLSYSTSETDATYGRRETVIPSC